MAVTTFGFQIASGLDSFYLTDSKYIKGTYTVVNGTTETKEQLQVKETIVEGSLVFDANEAKTYRWTNSAWVEEGSAGSGIIVCDTINDLPAASEHVGQIAYVKNKNAYFGSNGITWDELHHKPDLDYTITDVQNKDILVYDSTSKSWKNVKFDGNSIIYDAIYSVHISQFPAATEGQIPTKHIDQWNNPGIVWKDPLDQSALDAAVLSAATSAGEASTAKDEAIAAKDQTAQYEQLTQTKAQQMINFFNDKFWWGTAEEYNNLPEIKQDTIYFVEYIN